MTNARLTDLISRANSLLGDPHPGVMAWNEALGDTMTKIVREWIGEVEEPLNMNGLPLSFATIHQMVMSLCVDGEVHVVGCNKMGAGHALWLLQLMRKNLSEEDLVAIRQIVGAEIAQRMVKS